MSVDKEMNILIVDDDQTMVRIIRTFLLQLGFSNIDAASDGQAALEKISEKPYHLIISDWNMAPMTGLDLLKTIRTSGSQTPFIMVTAESKSENVMAAREAGVNNYIVKPFNADTLKTKLIAVLGEFSS